MRNKSVIKIVEVISKLVKATPRELIKDGFLSGIEARDVFNYRANYTVKMVGREWLAPLYRPLISTFTIKKGTFLAVRHNLKSCDIEYVNGTESTTFTMKKQDWNEKAPYFLLIPPDRFRGSLEDTVKQIRDYRRKQSHGRD